jgi:endonuclease III
VKSFPKTTGLSSNNADGGGDNELPLCDRVALSVLPAEGHPLSKADQLGFPVPQRRLPWGVMLAKLRSTYSGPGWRVPQLRPERGDPFRVLISTILSQRARDESTVKASMNLFRVFPSASSLSKGSLKEITRLTKSVGLSPRKVRGIRDTARILTSRFNGVVPDKVEDLLTFPMVGRKTANCTLVFGFGIPAIPVDTHLKRVANRLLGTPNLTAEETERVLERVVPRKYWVYLNPLLVQHGQNLCNALHPHCGACPILRYCAFPNASRLTRSPS